MAILPFPIYLTTPVQTTRIGPYDSHIWDRLMHIAAEIEAQRFCDCLAAVGVDNAHDMMQR